MKEQNAQPGMQNGMVQEGAQGRTAEELVREVIEARGDKACRIKAYNQDRDEMTLTIQAADLRLGTLEEIARIFDALDLSVAPAFGVQGAIDITITRKAQ